MLFSMTPKITIVTVYATQNPKVRPTLPNPSTALNKCSELFDAHNIHLNWRRQPAA